MVMKAPATAAHPHQEIRTVTAAELTPETLIDSTRLPGVLHRDPADRILAATVRHHGFTLVTQDRKLLESAKQGYLNVRTS